MDNVIGTCSLCGGAVVVPSAWYGTDRPTPSCRSCGATKANPHGPVIPMEPKPKPSKEYCVFRDGRHITGY